MSERRRRQWQQETTEDNVGNLNNPVSSESIYNDFTNKRKQQEKGKEQEICLMYDLNWYVPIHFTSYPNEKERMTTATTVVFMTK